MVAAIAAVMMGSMCVPAQAGSFITDPGLTYIVNTGTPDGPPGIYTTLNATLDGPIGDRIMSVDYYFTNPGDAYLRNVQVFGYTAVNTPITFSIYSRTGTQLDTLLYSQSFNDPSLATPPEYPDSIFDPGPSNPLIIGTSHAFGTDFNAALLQGDYALKISTTAVDALTLRTVDLNPTALRGLNYGDGSFSLSSLGGTPSLLIGTSSTSNSLPEPTTWAMMILGLGLVGMAMRAQPKSPAPGRSRAIPRAAYL